VPIALAHVCFEGEERKWRGLAAMSQFDPSATLAVHCGNALDAGFNPYQSTRMSR